MRSVKIMIFAVLLGCTSKERISLVICDGNSLTYGSSIEKPEQDSYPAVLGGMGFNVRNFGVPGQTSEEMLIDASSQIDRLYQPSAMVIYWEGVNSFTRSKHNAEKAYSALSQYIGDRKKRGFKTAVVTMLPDEKPAHVAMNVEAFQKAYNDLVRLNSAEADLAIDLTLDIRLNNPADKRYFAADRVHLTAEGYKVVAEVIANKIRMFPQEGGSTLAAWYEIYAEKLKALL